MDDNQLDLISFNCKSIYSNLSEIKLFIYNRKPHIVCFSETWIFNDKLPNFINYTAKWKSRTEGRGGGIGVLIRSDITVLPSTLQDFDDVIEIQAIAIKLKSFNLNIINVYNPDGSSNYHTLKKYFSQFSGNFIVVGDFNAHHNTWSLPGKRPNTSGKAIAQILLESSLCLATPPALCALC